METEHMTRLTIAVIWTIPETGEVGGTAYFRTEAEATTVAAALHQAEYEVEIVPERRDQ
jgi:hypothetical protein